MRYIDHSYIILPRIYDNVYLIILHCRDMLKWCKRILGVDLNFEGLGFASSCFKLIYHEVCCFLFLTVEKRIGENSDLYSSNPRRVGIYRTYTRASRWAPNTWAQYTPTPPRSLNYRRSGVQDWTRKRVQIEYKGQIPPADTTSHRLC